MFYKFTAYNQPTAYGWTTDRDVVDAYESHLDRTTGQVWSVTALGTDAKKAGLDKYDAWAFDDDTTVDDIDAWTGGDL